MTLQTERLHSVEQIRDFLDGNGEVDFRPPDREEAYGFRAPHAGASGLRCAGACRQWHGARVPGQGDRTVARPGDAPDRPPCRDCPRHTCTTCGGRRPTARGARPPGTRGRRRCGSANADARSPTASPASGQPVPAMSGASRAAARATETADPRRSRPGATRSCSPYPPAETGGEIKRNRWAADIRQSLQLPAGQTQWWCDHHTQHRWPVTRSVTRRKTGQSGTPCSVSS